MPDRLQVTEEAATTTILSAASAQPQSRSSVQSPQSQHMSNWATNWLISWTNRRPVGTSVIISWQQKQINCHSGRDKDKERERGERKSYLHSQTSPLLKTNICGQKRIRHKVNICRKRQQELQDLSVKSGHPFYTPRHLIRQRVNRQPARWTPSRAKLEPLNR